MATEFGKKLKELREAKPYTQKQIATSLGVTPRQIQRYEEGAIPRPNKVKALNKIFKFDFFTVMDDTKGRNGNGAQTSNDPLPSGDMKITLKDYLDEIKQQKEFLQELLLNKVGTIDANLKQALGGVVQLSLHVESAREVVLEALARLEKKPKGSLIAEADNIVKLLMKEHEKRGNDAFVNK